METVGFEPQALLSDNFSRLCDGEPAKSKAVMMIFIQGSFVSRYSATSPRLGKFFQAKSVFREIRCISI